MFDEEEASDYNSDDTFMVEIGGAPDATRAAWSKQLDRGWHGVNVADWAGLFLPAKLDADIRFLDLLVERVPAFARVAQRRRRDAVGRLARDQYLLPWTRKSQPQFFVENRVGVQLSLKDVEHGFPVAQVQSLVLMALEAGDVEQARKRLVYCWLIPTVHCTNITHRALPGRCEDFDRPLDRYSKRHQKLHELADREFGGTAMTLRRFDGTLVDPDTYSRAQLLDDLWTIVQLRPIIDGLEGLTLPAPDEEKAYTKLMTDRAKKIDA